MGVLSCYPSAHRNGVWRHMRRDSQEFSCVIPFLVVGTKYPTRTSGKGGGAYFVLQFEELSIMAWGRGEITVAGAYGSRGRGILLLSLLSLGALAQEMCHAHQGWGGVLSLPLTKSKTPSQVRRGLFHG